MKRSIYSVVVVMMLIMSSSCKKWLDTQPRDGITRQGFWKTKEDIQAAVAGCYASLLLAPPGNNDRALTEYIFMFGEIRADMIDQGPGSLNDEKDIFDVNITPSNSLVKWSAFYRTINFCNTVLDNAPAVRNADPTLTAEQLNAYLSEVLALRSMMYFYLVKSFRDVPLKLTATTKDTDLQDLPKTAAATILTQIVGDLKKAEAGAVTTYGNSVTDKGRVTKFTINALLADVYLWMDNYEGCITECNKIINSQRFAMQNAGALWYFNVFYNGSSTETVFEFNNTTSVNNIFYNLLVAPKKRFLAAPYLSSDVFTPDDVDPTVFYDVREEAFYRASDFSIVKWGTENPSFVNWQAYRITDIMLMKAEALAQTGLGADAIAIVEEIRLKRKAVAITAQTPDPADKDGICDYILSERSREFAFEGKRWYDILRMAKRDNYKRLDIMLNMVAQTVSPAVQQSAINKFRDINSHYFPIPETEIFADPQLVQNPFYTK
ncbi:RagB/SusD family nutrient uptake outer membrane protein [Pedobacter sp. HDW13]|uniref:RagB/SusD family nutrient uptake outer membrane protein n=1 Tax=unclassified Pedobacter TaxID=2628915 RepID=UPI000F5936B7|nr:MULTISPECIES: RagB/SusD family nutrient uptake outer membrane protein [unclassified Pedobacter]QIL38264.1 RagB/SusD family nutrient uptake outer membrane protein [Pedobacter sp. HDW13]RQO73696.1 RagB/SusD family nutrient uptake outer membrane protein [Pedobacter sp. KBW01]